MCSSLGSGSSGPVTEHAIPKQSCLQPKSIKTNAPHQKDCAVQVDSYDLPVRPPENQVINPQPPKELKRITRIANWLKPYMAPKSLNHLCVAIGFGGCSAVLLFPFLTPTNLFLATTLGWLFVGQVVGSLSTVPNCNN